MFSSNAPYGAEGINMARTKRKTSNYDFGRDQEHLERTIMEFKEAGYCDFFVDELPIHDAIEYHKSGLLRIKLNYLTRVLRNHLAELAMADEMPRQARDKPTHEVLVDLLGKAQAAANTFQGSHEPLHVSTCFAAAFQLQLHEDDEYLTAWEMNFLQSLMKQANHDDWQPSPKQLECLKRIDVNIAGRRTKAEGKRKLCTR